MPQASSELRAKFPNGDTEALDVIEVNFTESKGLITPKVAGYIPTDRESDAIDYLFQEWDYGYESK